MKQEKITIEFDDEKLEALRFHMEMKGLNLERELEETVQKTYERMVPSALRNFIERDKKDSAAKRVTSRKDVLSDGKDA